jgi:tetratricopeptide (TPR) repeat protein
MRLALSALAFALTIAGCSSPSTEGKSVSGLDESIHEKSLRSVPAHPPPERQAHPSTRALVVHRPAPQCDLAGLEADTVDADLWARLKLDFERHCYKQAVEAITGGESRRNKLEDAEAPLPNAVAPTDSGIVVNDAAAAPTVLGPTSTSVSASSPPLDAKFYRESAIAAYRSGDFSIALVDSDLAIRLDPSFEDDYIDRGIILYRFGVLDRAFDDVTRARRIENSHRIPTPPLPKASPLSNKN